MGAEELRLVFDRGTILVEGLSHGALAAFPGLTWDPRVGAHRSRACDLDLLKHALVAGEHHGVDAARAPLGDVGTWSSVDLRPYQAAALAAWEQRGRRGTIVLPTGAGKTRVAIGAIARLRMPALCLVPTRVLLDQWCREIAALYQGRVGCLGDGRREVAAITVATYESAYRFMDLLGNRFEVVVVDEAHHLGGGLRHETLEMTTAPHRLGLTATPTTDGDEGELGRLIGPKVFELGIRDLAGTYLAPFDCVPLELELDAVERRRYDHMMRTFLPIFEAHRARSPDSSWKDFIRKANGSDEGRRALAAWRRARRLVAYPWAKRAALRDLLGRHHGARTLIFTADNATAYSVAREHLVMPLTCDIPRKERAQALESFRHGTLRALVSAQVLNEGMDVPDADVAIVVAGAGSGREHVQRVGRLLRPAPGKRAVVYELIARGTMEVRQARRRRASLAARVDS